MVISDIVASGSRPLPHLAKAALRSFVPFWQTRVTSGQEARSACTIVRRLTTRGRLNPTSHAFGVVTDLRCHLRLRPQSQAAETNIESVARLTRVHILNSAQSARRPFCLRYHQIRNASNLSQVRVHWTIAARPLVASPRIRVDRRCLDRAGSKSN
jgi:hypothetical protein